MTTPETDEQRLWRDQGAIQERQRILDKLQDIYLLDSRSSTPTEKKVAEYLVGHFTHGWSRVPYRDLPSAPDDVLAFEVQRARAEERLVISSWLKATTPLCEDLAKDRTKPFGFSREFRERHRIAVDVHRLADQILDMVPSRWWATVRPGAGR